ncbi:hypothetical protein DSO57_1009612 [Entomophthora muscae]|uniref:Uncharacterized protein n=3 Tax=Entomophthora muscae TaxID=34485 RepID=A0ACC2SK66_9FUNG|nr:hypothetical protein DSO57_1034757 [Entomophthora muscae]KAJ9062556.1 hypothetical protein DSO57_1009612 [Entomophthora muscae]
MDVSFYKNISFLNLNLRVFSEMAVAEWNGKVIAESDKVEKVDGNLYFPKSSIKSEYFKEVSKTTHCPWKGDAKYYTLNVDGKENAEAAWYYPEPKEAAKNIKDHVAFWKGVATKE